jgi:hypothetical protein
MNKKELYVLFFVVVFIPFACKNRDSQSETINPIAVKESMATLSVHHIGELRFRRSYAAGMSEDLTGKELQRMMKAPPALYDDYDEETRNLGTIIEKFEFVKEGELLIEKFKYVTSPVAMLKDQVGKTVVAALKYDYIAGRPVFRLAVANTMHSATLKVDYLDGMRGLKYQLLNIIPGGYPEIVLLNEYYIMNGDNFDLFVFEIRE